MFRYKKLLSFVIVVDLLLLLGVFVLCVLADGNGENQSSDANKTGADYMSDICLDTSLTMERGALASVSKESIFDDGIYDRAVVPSGEPVGIYMKTDGVMVVDICYFRNENGVSCCPSDGILQTGDYITNADGKAISKRAELLNIVSECNGKSLDITFVRDGVTEHKTVSPERNENGNYLLGAWVKDDVSGIGTVTFVDGNNFMALGHSVSDMDTGLMMKCSTGGVYTTNITNISRSKVAEPGKLQGSIAYKKDLIGIIDGNSSSGIYGHMSTVYCTQRYVNAEKMYIAKRDSVHEGTAYIYSRMSDELRKYEIEIEQLAKDAPDKNMEFRVTSQELLDLTGGIVQGQSGSPIVQDGKIVGAVTHVFVDDPTHGYGIFIENMLR